jgi:uncharacterized membrane protein YdbT with pleckstrin-like domain
VTATPDSTESVDDAVPLDDGESVAWTGRPRWSTVLPAVAGGLLLAAVAAGSVAVGEAPPLVAAGGLAFGVAVPVWAEARRRGTQYLLTDRALYVRRGVVGRRVSQAALETVQNSSYEQDALGAAFGYGTVTAELAGGGDLTFRRVDDPDEVRRLVDRRTDGREREALPGDADAWRAVREEVRALRRAVEARRS